MIKFIILHITFNGGLLRQNIYFIGIMKIYSRVIVVHFMKKVQSPFFVSLPLNSIDFSQASQQYTQAAMFFVVGTFNDPAVRSRGRAFFAPLVPGKAQ